MKTDSVGNTGGNMKEENKQVTITRDHWRWAVEAMASFAAFRVNGAEPTIKQLKKMAIPTEWPSGLLPDILEEFEAWEVDFEMGDYLMVRDAVTLHVTKNPQDASLAELIVHLWYYHKPLSEFWVVPTFGRHPWQLKELGSWAIANANWAVHKVLRDVAVAKVEQERRKGAA
jgi:hypothetical protein